MVMLAAFLLVCSLLLVLMGTGAVATPGGSGVRKRARSLSAAADAASDTGVVKVDRTRADLWERLTPSSTLRRLERNLVLAGHPEGWTRERVVLMKPAAAALGLLFGALLVSKTSNPLMPLVALGIIGFSYMVPDLLVYNQATKRQDEIQKRLPDMLDQIVISLEAGVGFEAALSKAAERGTGPLAEEASRLMQDMSLGMARREAYLALAERTSVEELRTFCKAVVQAEEFGVSVASVVRSQAQEMRLSRRRRAEAKAQQVPVKILVPLMTCILPVLFAIVMGPAVVYAYAIN
ncbi:MULTISPECIES: type II secretion system F family protein [unclassified Aeromicrobium]|uniref:type II secretion system F family protein n=1 Tax=unclassified Aeromicrobium TaxID=2633570 RepID=UPI0020971265|nr:MULTISPECIES: type II secretion system F family protein [unclassified Aeromicrobium]MCO7239044.1 type II secretion system F family protein [Aeromicrobium sp. CnD17-E]MDR6120392.1 tight adherence protein C [Aeromicrobium sp. SORGH_AS_0981]